MSSLFKARHVWFDQSKRSFVSGHEMVLNMDHVIRFEADNTGLNQIKEAEEVKGIIFRVETIADNTDRSLRVTSKFLENLIKTLDAEVTTKSKSIYT